MKKIILISLLVLGCLLKVRAQIYSATLIVLGNPSALLSEWSDNNSVITYIVGIDKELQHQVIIKTELKLTDGTVIATTDLTRSFKHTLIRGSNIYHAMEVMPLENMVFTGSYRTSLQRSDKLPAGNYQISVQLLNAETLEPAFEVRSKFFNLKAYQLPVLMKPVHNDTIGRLEAQTSIVFRWTPVIPTITPPVSYHIQVFEVYDYQQPVQALRSNQPLLDITVSGQTQYIWRPQISFIEDSLSKRFIWTIQTLDGQNNPLIVTDGNGESRSEPKEFYVRTN